MDEAFARKARGHALEPAESWTIMTQVRHLRWWIVALITVGTVLNYLARNTLAVLSPQLKGDLGITTAQYSYIVGAFLVAYAVMQPVAGAIIDRIGLKRGFALFAAAWSIANMLHALASQWLGLAYARAFLGAAEAALVPAGMKAITEWFPTRERSIATGWFSSGTALGSAIAPPLVFGIAYLSSWQTAFVVTGGVGLIWAAAWYILYFSPADHPAITPDERDYILDNRPLTPPARAGAWEIVSTARFWAIATPRFFVDPAWQTFSFWVPLYLAKERGMDLGQIAMFAWLPFLAADLGGIFAGYLSPFLARRFGIALVSSRVVGISMGAVLMIGPGCIGLVESPYTVIFLFCVGGFAHSMISVLHTTLSAEIFSPREVATAVGFVGQVGWVGGALSTLAIGQLADRTGFSPIFAFLSVFDLIAATILILNLKRFKSAAQPRIPITD